MPDNPAVRAVANAPCTFEHGIHLNGDSVHPECALAALASSQEVWQWLSEIVRSGLKDSGDLAFGDWGPLSEFVAERILNALGGGEG